MKEKFGDDYQSNFNNVILLKVFHPRNYLHMGLINIVYREMNLRQNVCVCMCVLSHVTWFSNVMLLIG